MKKNILNYLCCTSCKNDLFLPDSDLKDEIIEGKLICTKCKKIFNIVDGVPVFTEDNIESKVKLTAQNFGYSWKKFSTTNKAFYKKQFFDWISPIDEKFLENKLILDGGCGKGHHLLMVSPFVQEAIGVDISDAAFVAYENTKHLSNIHIIKADLNNLPLKNELFDYIYSVGVIHHTEDPSQTTKSLFPRLKNKGIFSIWVYGKENNDWVINYVTPFRNFLTSMFHPKIIYLISLFLAVILFLVLKMIYLPVKKIAILKLLRSLLFYYPYLSYICEFDFNEINNIIFDHIVAPTSYYLSKNDLENMVKPLSDKFLLEWHNKNSWKARVFK